MDGRIIDPKKPQKLKYRAFAKEMKNIKVMYMHKSDMWKTPKEIYESYIYQGYFDPCPSNPIFDGLKIRWGGKNFVNPPYSQIKQWVRKAIWEVNTHGCEVVFLVPARTDTAWFHELLAAGAKIEFIKGHLKFNDGKQGAPFPSILITLKK